MKKSRDRVPALPPLPPTLLIQRASADHIAAARIWGYRIGLAARDALGASDALERAVGPRSASVEAISRHFGLANEQHSLHVDPFGWLRLSETQATGSLRHFLAAGDGRARLFLKALAPEIDWPSDLDDFVVVTETRAGRGRIDLLIHAKSRGAVWGAVIEAKFENSISGNPLPDYLRHGTRLGMRFAAAGAAKRTGALIVLGKRVCRQTRKRLARNGQWRFVHWREVLRRFDAGLADEAVDEDFRRFRRTLWDRSGG